jgi:hypothetical protein
VGDLSHARGLEEADASGLLALPWPATPTFADWPALRAAMDARGLALTDEARLRAVALSHGDSALARPGFAGAVLLFAARPGGRLALVGAVLRGRLVGEVAPARP